MRTVIFVILVFSSIKCYSQSTMNIYGTIGQPNNPINYVSVYDINQIDSVVLVANWDQDTSIFFSPVSIQNVTAVSASITIVVYNFFGFGNTIYNTDVQQVGFLMSTNPNPLISNSTICSNITNGSDLFWHNCIYNNLNQNTQYFVRGFAQFPDSVHLGQVYSFTTLPNSVTFPFLIGSGVTDYNGNFYPSVILENGQEWMTQDLKATSYSNGDPITYVEIEDWPSLNWISQTEGAYTYYDNNISNQNLYGSLYNTYVVSDNRNVCPTGWHIPSTLEWLMLANYFQGTQSAGLYLKSSINSNWQNPSFSFDAIGFTAQAGGHIEASSEIQLEIFWDLGYTGTWWTTSILDPNSPGFMYRQVAKLYYDSNALGIELNMINEPMSGFYIRCLKN